MPAKLIIRTSSSSKEVQRILEDTQEAQIGRSPACSIHISDPKLSRIHCTIYIQAGNFYIKDMGSCNGTYVNQKRIQTPTLLNDGDTIKIGDSQLQYCKDANTKTKSQELMPAFQTIGEYEYIKNLGSGGIGQVFLVKHQKSSMQFALKILNPEAATDPAMVNRFLREARACSILNHPNLIRLFDVGVFDERPYLVLEYAPGKALSDFVFERRKLDVATTLHISFAVATALEYAHKKNIIHRDIKPSNILVSDDLKVKLIDLGMVKILNESGITLSGQTLGTPRYMPPEQIEDSKSITPQADIYSFGATIYSMLAGVPPYHEVRTPHLSELLQAIIARPPIPIETLVTDLPPNIVALVNKSMARDMKIRFRTATEIYKEIQKLMQKFPLKS